MNASIPNTEIDADSARQAALAVFDFESRVQAGEFSRPGGDEAHHALRGIIARAIEAANAKARHFEDHFQKLARVYGPANAALDTARREWAKRGEGK